MNIKSVINQSNKEVKFDTLVRAIINDKTTSFRTQLGTSVRAHIPIHYQEWPDVPKHIKETVWQDIKLDWNLLENEDLKKEITSEVAVFFRRFRSTLNNDFVKEGKTPFDEYKSIEPHDWAAFIEYHQSEEFQKQSRQGKAKQSKNLYSHFLESRGYKGEKF